MTQPQNSADFPQLVSRASFRVKFRNALHLYIGRGRRYSVKQVSNATGVKDRVIECAMSDPEAVEYRDPSISAIMSLAMFLGPEFTTEWLSVAGQGAFLIPTEDGPPPGALAADNCDDNAQLVRSAIDNQFDPEERRTLRPVGIRMMARGAHLAFGTAA